MLEPKFLEAIKTFEGFEARARWDYAQDTNGYGTRAKSPGEVIDKPEAERRFRDEISRAAAFVDKIAPNLDEGSRAAMTSLTFNAGTAWTRGELGRAIVSGDLETARDIFLKYNKAGGDVLEGLTRRRVAEAAWIGSGQIDGQSAVANTIQSEPSTNGSSVSTASLAPRINLAAFNVEPTAAAPTSNFADNALQSLASMFGSGSTFDFRDPRAALIELLSLLMSERETVSGADTDRSQSRIG